MESSAATLAAPAPGQRPGWLRVAFVVFAAFGLGELTLTLLATLAGSGGAFDDVLRPIAGSTSLTSATLGLIVLAAVTTGCIWWLAYLWFPGLSVRPWLLAPLLAGLLGLAGSAWPIDEPIVVVPLTLLGWIAATVALQQWLLVPRETARPDRRAVALGLSLLVVTAFATIALRPESMPLREAYPGAYAVPPNAMLGGGPLPAAAFAVENVGEEAIVLRAGTVYGTTPAARVTARVRPATGLRWLGRPQPLRGYEIAPDDTAFVFVRAAPESCPSGRRSIDLTALDIEYAVGSETFTGRFWTGFSPRLRCR